MSNHIASTNMLSVNDYMEIIRAHQQAWPVKMVPIARALGLKVYKVDSWDDDLSGMIKKTEEHGGKSGYAIFVNKHHPNTRRRFTIAHEIAHFLLHKKIIGDGVSDDALYRSGLSSTVEAEANRFAADLLMPWHLINAAMKQGLSTVEELAAAFEVSKTSMTIRLGVPGN